jgi:hypothetical protein
VDAKALPKLPRFATVRLGHSGKFNHGLMPICDFVVLKPALKSTTGITFYRDITNQFSNEVFAVKFALAGAFVDTDVLNIFLDFFARDYHFRSSVLGLLEV